jgi:hypothetical protein
LEEQADALLKDPLSPLLDRAVQNTYPPGADMLSWLQAIGLSAQPAIKNSTNLFTTLGFYTAPVLQLPVSIAVSPEQPLRLSPLQVALAAAAIGDNGLRPAPRIATAVKSPLEGWVVLPQLGQPVQALPANAANSAAQALMVKGRPFWQWSGLAGQGTGTVSWSLAGTLPNGQGIPLAVVVLLEDPNQQWAAYIGEQLLEAALQP